MPDTATESSGQDERRLRPGQRCRIRVLDGASGAVRTVHESGGTLFEAPNWTPGGRLVVNGEGVLWSLAADGSDDPVRIRIDGVPALNNDHVLDPTGDRIFVSAEDAHLYEAPLAGGTARRITSEEGPLHFLHGVSPDGRTLAYVRLEP